MTLRPGSALERLAVGDHLLLGGDNIDIALARALEPQLVAAGSGQLDSQRWHALTNLCRSAKETLLAEGAAEDFPIRLVGRGRSVVGGTLAATLARTEVERTVLDGFFPAVDRDALPRRTARTGLQEWGLPFATEPEVTRHLAAFLERHRDDVRAVAGQDDGRPDGILFNGGALKPAPVRNRLRDVVGRWYADGAAWTPAILASVDLDLAVARGAAYYGLVRRGAGVRIGGGAARAYFVGVAPAGSTTPSPEAAVTTLCLVQRGMQEGDEVEIGDPPLELITNRPVSFPLYASSTRLGDRAGQPVVAARDSLTELPPIRTVLRFGKKLEARTLPVHLLARLTEVGTIEIWCRSLTTEHRWRLQFQLRDQAPATERDAGDQQAEAVVSDAALETAAAAIRAVFAPAPGQLAADPLGLVRVLEGHLGTGKDGWPLTAIRKLWDVLWQVEPGRGASPHHEARWLNLSGFLLRPGFGAEMDEWRMQQLWKAKSAGLRFAKAAQSRAEWWNMWKRVAGGLSRQQQGQLHAEVAMWLVPRLRAKTKGMAKVGPQELREFWQLVASCERLSAELKAELGRALLPAVVRDKATEVEIWALGRLGARAPVYGPLNCVATARRRRPPGSRSYSGPPGHGPRPSGSPSPSSHATSGIGNATSTSHCVVGSPSGSPPCQVARVWHAWSPSSCRSKRRSARASSTSRCPLACSCAPRRMNT